jgi:hypothetical protein
VAVMCGEQVVDAGERRVRVASGVRAKEGHTPSRPAQR